MMSIREKNKVSHVKRSNQNYPMSPSKTGPSLFVWQLEMGPPLSPLEGDMLERSLLQTSSPEPKELQLPTGSKDSTCWQVDLPEIETHCSDCLLPSILLIQGGYHIYTIRKSGQIKKLIKKYIKKRLTQTVQLSIFLVSNHYLLLSIIMERKLRRQETEGCIRFIWTRGFHYLHQVFMEDHV